MLSSDMYLHVPLSYEREILRYKPLRRDRESRKEWNTIPRVLPVFNDGIVLSMRYDHQRVRGSSCPGEERRASSERLG
jgi:hypothetical protein